MASLSRCVLAALAGAGVLRGSAAAQAAPWHRHEESRMAMGCAFAIVAIGDDPSRLVEAVAAAFREIDRLDRLMSHYDPESPLSRLNREAAARPVATEPELFAFLEECRRQSEASGGAFDVTVGPLVRAWGFFRGEGRLPTPAEAATARARVGYRNLRLDPTRGTVHFLVPGMELDLGGIAKGYAVDRAVAVLRTHGIGRALVNAGGSSIHGLGSPPDQGAWEVAVRSPRDPSKAAFSVRLQDRSLSLSGRAEKSFEADGRTYSHIMDPRSGRPVEGDVLGVGILSASATEGDALDDAFFVEGMAATRRRLPTLPGTTAFFFLRDGPEGYRVVRLGD